MNIWSDQVDQAIPPSDTKLDHAAHIATIAVPKLTPKINGFYCTFEKIMGVNLFMDMPVINLIQNFEANECIKFRLIKLYTVIN